MDLNTIFLFLLGILVLYIGYTVWTTSALVTLNPIRNSLLVTQDVGKSKQIVSQTGDASMSIESTRRRVIHTSGKSNINKIRENRTQIGSKTGAIETFMLTSICPFIPFLPYDIIYDGGYDYNEFCPYNGDGLSPLDAGNETTKACGV